MNATATRTQTTPALPRTPRAARQTAAASAPLHRLTLTEKLDRLAELKEQEAAKAAKLDRRIAKLVEERDELVAIELLAIEQLENLIKTECIEQESSMQGAALQVIYIKGRRGWDTERLEGYATDHPDILQFQKVGHPTAKIVPLATRN